MASPICLYGGSTCPRRLSCPGRLGDCSTKLPTEPDVNISLIRFLGIACLHTISLQTRPRNGQRVMYYTRRSILARSPREREGSRLFLLFSGRARGRCVLCRPNRTTVLLVHVSSPKGLPRRMQLPVAATSASVCGFSKIVSRATARFKTWKTSPAGQMRLGRGIPEKYQSRTD